MRASRHLFAFSSLALLWTACAAASAQPGDKPLSDILKPVEAHGTAISADLKRNRWEVMVCQRRGVCTEFYLDRATGEELRREREVDLAPFPPQGAKPLSAIAASLEQRGLGGITEVEFDERGQWDVEVRTAQSQRLKMRVDPMSAEITRCRGQGCP